MRPTSVSDIGTLDGTECIAVDKVGESTAKHTTPARIKTYIAAPVIGTGATDAAAGNHNHPGTYATAAQGTNADAARVDVQMYGFLNQTETTIGFNPTGDSGDASADGLFTLGCATTWSYYKAGVKYTITGAKSVDVPAATTTTTMYYIYINGTDGALTCATGAWNLDSDGRVPVATVARNSALTPAYLLAEERHTVLISRRDHLYRHIAKGADYASGGNITGVTASTDTLAAISPAVAACYWFDEDIYQVSSAITDNQGLTATPYSIAYKTGANAWAWERSLVPYKYTTNGFIEITNNTSGTVAGVAAWTTGAHNTIGTSSYVNYFMLVCSVQGQESVFFIPGQTVHTTTTAAYAEAWGSINIAGFPCNDGVAVYQFTYRCNGTLYGKVTLTRSPVRISGNIISSTVVSATSHNGLAGIQGGTTDQYYHLTAAELASVVTGGGHTIQDEGTPLTQRTTMNFVGSGVTAADSGGVTVVTIPGGGVETCYAPGNTGATKAIDLANGTLQMHTLDQACTITLPVTTAGQSLTLVLTGNYAVTWAAGSGRTLKWAGGTAPTRTSASGKYDIYVFCAVDSTDTLGRDGGRNI